jgi:hypothetical protein
VDDLIELGTEGGAGTLVIARVVMLHLNTDYLDMNGRLDPAKIDQVGRMGGSWYCRAGGGALFEIPRPIARQGIGVDALPASIRASRVLTGNNLGRLGNVERLPEEAAIQSMAESDEVRAILEQKGTDTKARADALHRFAQSLLNQGETEKALCVLLFAS